MRERQRKLIVGGSHDHIPYAFLENGQPSGFTVDLLRAMAEAMGLEIEIRLGPWAEVREGLETGQLDMAANMAYSVERDKHFDFSVPHAMLTPCLVVRNDSPIRSFDDVWGREIIVHDKDIMHDFLKELSMTSQIIPIKEWKDAWALLASGNHDGLLIGSHVNGLYMVQRHGFTNLRLVPTCLPSRPSCFAVTEGKREIIQTVNEGLTILAATGKYQQIYDKWLGVYEPRGFQFSKALAIVLGIVGTIASGSLLWSWSLRRQVRIRTTELRSSEERFRTLVEQAPEAIVVYDKVQGKLVEANRNAERLFGCTRDEILRAGLASFYAAHQPDGRPVGESFEDHIRRGLAGEELAFERVIHPRGGGEVYCDVRMVPLPAVEQGVLRISLIDITQRKRAEDEVCKHRDHLEDLVQERTAQLRTVTRQLIVAEKRERRRLAYVLHENLQQLLVAAKFNIQMFRDNGRLGSASQAVESLDQAIAVSRSLTTELHPPVLYQLGLGAGLEWLARQIWDKYQLAVELAVDPEAEPPCEDIQFFLFEAVRELLLNVAKHAKVDHAEVQLSRHGDEVQVLVVDHGKGFDPSQLKSESFGLFSLRERVELLGGRIEIDSQPSLGTRITLAVPVPAPAAVSRTP